MKKALTKTGTTSSYPLGGVVDIIVGLRGERKPPASAVGIANPLEL